jgi:signal transduction histidine kinase
VTGGSTSTTGAAAGGGAVVDPYEIACSFAESLDLDQTFWRVAQNSVLALGQGQCLLFEYDHGQNALSAVAASGTDVRAFVGRSVPFAFPGPPLELMRGAHGVDLASLADQEEDLGDLWGLLDSGTSLTLPLVLRNELVGAQVFIGQNREVPFSLAELALMTRLAKLAACAIHNARLFRNALRGQGRLEAMLTRMSRVHDRERQAFAGMVHDDILQPMVGAIYALEGLHEMVRDEAVEDFEHIVHMLRMSVEDARRMIWELRPAVLDGLGLPEALAVIADRIAVDRKIQMVTSLKDIEGLSERLSTAVYKIGREALLNAERHAHAAAISIWLSESDVEGASVVNLGIQDDGVGFDRDGDRPAGHYGLVMMEEQAISVAIETDAVVLNTQIDD